MTPAERRERARLASETRWSRAGSRQRQADAARAALRRLLAEQVDPDGLLEPDDLDYAVAAAMKARMARLRFAQAKAGRVIIANCGADEQSL